MKIFFIGDVGAYNEATENIFKNINKISSKEDIILLLGDNFYPNGIVNEDDEKFRKFIDLENKIPVYAVLGNHDYLGNIKLQKEFNKGNWNMPNNYYKVSTDEYDIFIIDTSILIPDYSNLNYTIVRSKLDNEPLIESKKQINWLEEELELSKKKKIICGHYPIISFGMYGVNKKLFEILFPILEKYNVEFYASGHDHNLQIVDITTENYFMKQIVSGSGSHVYPVIKNASNKIFSRHGYLALDTNEDTLTIYKFNNDKLFSEKL